MFLGKKRCALLLAGIASFAASGAAAAPQTLEQIEALHAADPSVETTVDADTKSALNGGLRRQSIKEEASRTGMQAGLAWRYREIEASLERQHEHLSQIYDFSRVMVNDFVIPPVITMHEQGFRQIDENTAHGTRAAYRIEYPARIVTTPPQWMDFLIKHFRDPEPPLDAVLPRNPAEQAIWKQAADQGWTRGVAQADQIFDASLALLTRTFQGMLNYHILLKEGIVSQPVTATADLGLVVNGREMNVGETIYRITDESRFQPAQKWTPLPRETTR